MKDISQLEKEFSRFIERLEGGIIEAQKEATEVMLDEAKERLEIPAEARNQNQFIQYANSLQIKEPKKEKDGIVSDVHSDLKVGGYSKWADVPVGAFLEWGTGPLGEASNTFPHGYPYTTDAPWDYHTWLQSLQVGSWGIVARPHLYPALLSTRKILEENLKEVVREKWME